MPTKSLKSIHLVVSLLLVTVHPAQAQFTASADIGNPAFAGSLTTTADGYTIAAGGTNIFGASDQFFFAYQEITGDFDYQVRIASLSFSEVWAKAGLMARETLSTNSRHASAFTTPNVSGTFFSFRSTNGGGTTNLGSFPTAYPNTWLRLKRAGNAFTGYAGVDGQTWSLLGSVTLNAPSNTVYLGMAVTAASASRTTSTEVRDIGTTLVDTVAPVRLPFEPMGPSSRKTGLIISEIMYHPRHSNDLEFIEIFNAGLIDEDLNGYRLTGAIAYTFPSNTVLRAGELLVVGRRPTLLQQVYGISGVLGPWLGEDGSSVTNALPDDTGRIRLRNGGNAVLLEVNYRGGGPVSSAASPGELWPVAADGAGHSLVLARPSYGENDVRAWAISDRIGGSPGRLEPFTPDPMRTVVINEFFANSDAPDEDFVELYNASSQSVDISGAYLTDDRDTNKFRIPNDTILAPRAFISFTESTLGFALSSGGERIYLVNSNQTRFIDALAFDAPAAGISTGRTPDGSPAFSELASRTPGTSNSAPLLRPIIINEIMFNSISDDDDDEYVEFYNRSTNAVNISGWRMVDAITFTFPSNTVITAGGYLVLARNRANLLTNYPQLNAGNTVGDYSGALDNAGERLALAMPEYSYTTNQSVITTNIDYVVVSELTYRDESRWSQWADGGGSSLELTDPNCDPRLLANWADSDETAKSSWTNVVHFDVLDNVYPVSAAGAALDEVQVMLLGRGEALLDDIEVHGEIPSTGPNLVTNGTFNIGLAGWRIQGNHVRSGLEPAGPNNPSHCLRLRASSGGDNGANRVETKLTGTTGAITNLPPNIAASVRCNLRWLRGHRDVLVRFHGGGLDAPITLPVPSNLGTPGLPNSQLVANAGPAIYDVSHSPVLPAVNEPVLVTARVTDSDGVDQVQLLYRFDPSTTLNPVIMRDDGTAGDALPGDGIYSGNIPGHPANAIVAFRIAATDDKIAGPGTTLFPTDAPARECLIRFGETQPAGNLGIYRLWMTTSNTNRWATREGLSNEALDGTFVVNNFRVIYNAGARYRGSPFIRPGYNTPVSNACGYVWTTLQDDLYLGEDEFNLDSLEPGGRDSTALREVTSFTFLDQLDLPSSYQRFVHVVINGINNTMRGIPIYADSQQPNSQYITSWFPDNDDGDLFKIDDWFEFDDTPTRQSNKSASLQNFATSGGVKDKGRYRWSWEKKANRGLDDDYSPIFAAVAALNTATNFGPAYVAAVESVFDIEEWLATLAFRHVIGDWDGYGYSRGKNQFSYFGPDGKWRMLMWDLDFSLGCTGGHGPTQDLFTVALGGDGGSDHMPEVANLYNFAHFRRIYLRALYRFATGPLQDSAFMPVLDARYRSLQANGVNPTSPYVPSGAQGISVPAWIQQRRNNIFTLMARMTNNFVVFGPSSITTNASLVAISGYAPLLVKDILVNGVAYPVTWTTVTNWTARLVPAEGANVFDFAGVDLHGNIITTTQSVSVTHTGAVVSAEGVVVFNEIMYNPVVPNASFVEIYNTSSNLTFDLSGWRINGLDYRFRRGTILTNGQHLLLVKNRAAFTQAYTNALPVMDEFDGNLDLDGETLTLLQPGTNGTEIVIDRVRYEPGAPWPPVANRGGASLQLIDASQDNSRVSNWSDNVGWRKVVFTATVRGSTNPALQGTNLHLLMDVAGDVYVDDFWLAQGTVAEAGTNTLQNGGFEEPLDGNWIVPLGVMSNSVVSTEVKRTGNASMHLIARSSVGLLTHAVQQKFPGNTNDLPYTLSFWYLPSTNGNRLNPRIFSGTFSVNVTIRPVSSTPGTTNNVLASLPPYPPLWLNEVQPQNASGIRDGAGAYEPWVELYNGGSNVLSLDGYYLSDSYTNLTNWAFPAGTTIAPGHKIVWLDGHAGETAGDEIHTSFAIGNPSGSIALSRLIPEQEQPQIVDYLNYNGLAPDLSYGDLPDGQPFTRQVFYGPTPATTNTAPPVSVFINEWMASNQGSVIDPADNRSDDWFELYNGDAVPVDISRYSLRDSTTQFRVPNGTVIPPHGYLLVWADNDNNQNGFNSDLHTNFELSRTSESIALYNREDVLIDSVTFSNQFTDISQGRYPDGTAAIQFFNSPTPRAANTPGGNAPPAISPIADVNVTEGQTVTVPVNATDPDTPLSYSLDAAPAGASINANTGLFSWTTQAPTTNQIVARVTDSGNPPASATVAFTVRVHPKARAAITPGSGSISLTFPTLRGKTYRVEYTDSLGPGPITWQSLVGTFTATTDTRTIPDNSVGMQQQRFYRIVQLN